MRAVLSLALVVVACSRVDGVELAADFHGSTVCGSDLDCGPGRHCDAGLCAATCTAPRDCASGTACSACGRCVAAGARDDGCIAPTDRECATDGDCGSLGSGWSCDGSHRCARACAGDDGCADFGRGFGCAANLCTRVCTRDDECFIHGYGWSCVLPPGVDPAANEGADEPVRGTCAYDAARVSFPPASPTDPAAAQLQGIWGFLVVSAVRTQGIPLVGRLDTASIQHLIVRMKRDGESLALEEQWCSTALQNFVEDDGPVLELFKVVLPDRNLSALRAVSNRIDLLPPLAAGATFVTREQLDLRGAKLANPLTDPLPTYKDLTHAWDQDHDGHPGLTAKVTGAVSGDMYQAQRWRATFHGVVVDRDHLHGLATGPSDQTILGATSDRLINDSFSTEHPQADRSYFRAVRLRADASCRDVARLASTEGSWLFFEPHFDPNKKP